MCIYIIVKQAVKDQKLNKEFKSSKNDQRNYKKLRETEREFFE